MTTTQELDAPAAAAIAPEERARLFELAALLLTYPDAELLGARAQLAAAAQQLRTPEVADAVTAFLEWFGATPDGAVAQHYVQTFDLRRKSGLYLTYYLHGDTRKRGLALLTLKQRYRAAGFSVSDRVLPDFLPVLLEFAAVAGPGAGEAPLRQHRTGLALLAAALDETASPYAAVVHAVCAVLPEMTEADRAAVAALASDGPLDELVGLDPYGPTLDDPSAASHPGAPSLERCS